MLDVYISYFKCNNNTLIVIAKLSEIDVLYSKILINLISKIEINKNNYDNINQYLLLLNKDLRKQKINMIDEIIYKLINYELRTFTQTKKLYILNHITMYFDKYITNLPISSKLRYYNYQIVDNLITSNRHNIIYERTKTLDLIDKLFDIEIDANIIKYNKLIIDKRKFIKKMIHENFAIFPCINKLPCIKGWNKILTNNSIKFYSGSNKIPEKYEDMFLNDNLYKNIGLLCGQNSNIFIIDIDNKDNGMNYWNNLLDKYNDSKDVNTLRVTTGSKGKHYYFKIDNTDKFYTKNKIFSTLTEKIGIDIRRDDGYIIAPFSLHENNNYYYFENYDETKTIREQINTMPLWLYNELNKYYQLNNKDNNIINNENENGNDTIDNKIENIEMNIDEYFNINDNKEQYLKKGKKLKEIKEETDLKDGEEYPYRYFTSIYMDKNAKICREGRYKSHINRPIKAAKKALHAICDKEEIENINVKFIIKECTRWSSKKMFAYEGIKIKFAQPITVKCDDTTITYHYDYNVKKISLEECEYLINDIKNKEEEVTL